MRLRIPSRTWRTTAALAAGATAVAGGLTVTWADPGTTATTSPVAYNARTAQGGCNTYDAGGLSGFDIGVCVNDRATGTTAYPDIYVNTTGSLARHEPCKIDIEIWDDHNHKLGDTTTDCALGHHADAKPVTPNGAATVHAFARLWFDGESYWTGDSPSVSLAPDATAGVPAAGSDPVAAALAETRQLTAWADAFPPPVLVSRLVSHIEALNDGDLDRYLTGVPHGDLDRLSKVLDSYFKNPLSSGQRMSFADNVLSRASQKAIASVDAQLQALQPPLAVPATGWASVTAPLFNGAPTINDGGQRDLNDCYFHAELLAVAAVDPGLIQNQLRTNANGTYSVKLYNGDGQPFWITVTADLPTGGTPDTYTYDDVTEGAWTAIYEKAFAQLSGGYDRITATGAQGLLVDGFAAITGNQPTTHQTPSLTEVAQAVARHQPVVVSTVTTGITIVSPVETLLNSGTGTINLPVDILDRTGRVTHSQVRNGLHYDHNYVVQSVDVMAGTVTLINPWGWNLQTPEGTFSTPRILVHWNQPTGDAFTPIFPGDITLTVGKLPR